MGDVKALCSVQGVSGMSANGKTVASAPCLCFKVTPASVRRLLANAIQRFSLSAGGKSCPKKSRMRADVLKGVQE